MDDEEILDVESDFDFANGNGLKDDFHDVYDLPSKSANLLPEFTSPEWMLEQGWSLDSCMDEKSKATIEKMLLEEQHYMGGFKSSVPKKNSGTSRSPKSKQNGSPQKQKRKSTPASEGGKKKAAIHQEMLATTSSPEMQFEALYAQSFADAVTSVTTGQPTVRMPPQSSRKSRGKGPSASSKQQSKGKLGQNQQKRSKLKVSNSLLNKSTKVLKRDVSLLAVSQDQRDGSIIKGGSSLHCDEIPFTSGSSPGMIFSENDSDLFIRTDSPLKVDRSLISSEVTSIEQEDDLEEDVDIDIENDFDEENPLLQNCPRSPNTVYQSLVQASDVKEETVEEMEPLTGADETPSDDVESKEIDSSDTIWQGQEIDNIGAEESKTGTEITGIEEDAVLEQSEGSEDFTSVTADAMDERQGKSHSFLHDLVLKIPLEEKVLPPDRVTEEEKTVHSDFFDGRPPKTPERYLKIRNYIIECWTKIKPTYLNKTRIRSGLKNCGDVNCIGRIHSYLECIGAINFGSDQAIYHNLQKTLDAANRRQRVRRDTASSQNEGKSEHMLPRKRRKKNEYGTWVDAKELEGKTIAHELQARSDSKAARTKTKKVQYDPFKLVPCKHFCEEFQAPYSVEVFSTALTIMDIHSHISKTEVIGMLGGHFNSQRNCLTISLAVPCKSMSTGLQCEMDPVSQTLAKEKIEDAGMSVVGWYHSHPTFRPDPSVRDIETQLKFQHWFSQGGNHFVGMIISPYNPGNLTIFSDVQCLTVSDIHSEEFVSNVPYKFAYKVIYKDNVNDIMEPARELAEKYCTYVNRVKLSSQYGGMSCLQKMLQSVKRHFVPESAAVWDVKPFLAEEAVTDSLGELFPLAAGSSSSETWWRDTFVEASSSASPIENEPPVTSNSDICDLLQQLESVFADKFSDMLL